MVTVRVTVVDEIGVAVMVMVGEIVGETVTVQLKVVV
jgi:hypothetical protein